MMENPVNLKSASIKKHLFEILGVISKRYNTTELASSIVNSLLCKFEHVARPLVELMEAFANTYGNHQLVSNVLCDVGKLDPKDLSHDSAASKGVGTFLTEVATKLPQIALSSVSVVLNLLEGDVSLVACHYSYLSPIC